MPVREVALALGCLLGTVFGGFGRFWRVWRVWRVLEGVWRFWQFGAFAGGQTAALKAHRKPLLWPWPWGACWGSGLGPGVPAGQGVWRVWTVLESARRVWRVLEGLEGFGGWSDRTSSTPAVVPGAAPALAKAGVGGYTLVHGRDPIPCRTTYIEYRSPVKKKSSIFSGTQPNSIGFNCKICFS